MIFYQTAKLKDVEDCPYFVSCSVSIPLWYVFQFHYGTIKSLTTQEDLQKNI